MKYIYINNFKGIQDTLLPIKDVNFFVGENSSGKTSVLSILYLLSDFNFWFRQEFKNTIVDLGSFNDLISIGSNNKKSFSIGLINSTHANTKYDRLALLMTFENDDGIPKLTQFNYLTQENNLSIVLTSSKILYKVNDRPSSPLTPDDILKIFKSWTDSPPIPQDDLTLLTDKKRPTPVGSSFFYIIHLVNSKINKEHEEVFDSIHIGTQQFIENLLWYAPIRVKPQKTYDSYKIDFSPEGEHTPYLLNNIIANDNKILNSIIAFGKSSGLFEGISTKNYGEGKDSPFALNVTIDGKVLKIPNVGYGVSQVLPIVIDMIRSQKRTAFAIQQPEVHLHPKAQAHLGELIFYEAFKEQKRFIIETHSDFIIDRFRKTSKRNSEHKLQSQVVFFERKKGQNILHQIPIDNDGEYSEEQPNTFREFFLNEELANLAA